MILKISNAGCSLKRRLYANINTIRIQCTMPGGCGGCFISRKSIERVGPRHSVHSTMPWQCISSYTFSIHILLRFLLIPMRASLSFLYTFTHTDREREREAPDTRMANPLVGFRLGTHFQSSPPHSIAFVLVYISNVGSQHSRRARA